jgi:ABC-type sugar transport system ATPase subunit
MFEVRDLTKHYAGIPVVDHVSFTIRRCETLGYLGPNGAGKSTTVKMIIGLLNPTAGEISLDGRDIHKDPEARKAFQRRVGYVPEEPHLYPHLGGREHLQLVGRLRGLSRQILYVFLVLAHDRRRILQFRVTAHPTAEWTVQQLRNAFPWESVPRYLLRDRDRIFGEEFVHQVKAMGIKQVLSAPRSPWQRAYVERLIGSIRRECLDHVVVFNESSLRRTLTAYCGYYHNWRTHLSLGKDAPEARRVQFVTEGEVVEMPAMGGLHHRYERRAA